MSSHYHELRRNDEYGLQKEVVTKRDANGFAKKGGKVFYFIDNDEREFTDIDALCDAYNEKFNFAQDHPDYELKYVKVIVKRNGTSPH